MKGGEPLKRSVQQEGPEGSSRVRKKGKTQESKKEGRTKEKALNGPLPGVLALQLLGTWKGNKRNSLLLKKGLGKGPQKGKKGEPLRGGKKSHLLRST